MTPPAAALGAASLGAATDGAATDGAVDGAAAGVVQPIRTRIAPVARLSLKIPDMCLALLARARYAIRASTPSPAAPVTAVLLRRTRSRAHLPASRVLVRRSRRTAPRMIRPFTICCEKGETPSRFRRLF